MSQQQQQSASQNMSAGAQYSPAEGTYDDAASEDGELHPHWRKLLDKLNTLGVDNLNQRHNKTQRILRDDGATYKAYDDSLEQSWNLDPVPLLIDEDSWGGIEQGLSQRTTLYDALLKDIYGKQDIIRQGVIPPEAIFANPGFLRPCMNSSAIAEQGLLLHAVDIVRTKDHQAVVIGDRSQSPSGAGNALEHRTVMNRVFPGLFKDTSVRRLAMFFQTMRHKLNQLSHGNELPNIVMLSPGPRSESYFEHAYLANYLGYSLVQGRDLTVRNGYVWTKSLGGLTRVDVILRRIDDLHCDPAELRSDSYLGVPGLLEVVRSRKVTVANPIGSAALESGIFLKYIDDISQFFMGESLILPTAKTYWAYDKHDLAFILENIRQLVIKPSFKTSDTHNILGYTLNDLQVEEVRQNIIANPLRYVAQEFIAPSYTPTWDENQFVPRPSVLRCFTTSGESSFSVMPGGLTRTAKQQDDYIISHQLIGLSKDTWVLTSEPEQTFSLWNSKNESAPFEQEERPALPSRVVENMFWLGRYSVRAESALRLLRTIFIQLNHSHQLSDGGKKTLLAAVTSITNTHPGFINADDELLNEPESELMSVILDVKRPGSLMSCFNDFLECAEEVKPLLSADTQRVVNDIRDEVMALDNSLQYDFASAPEEALDPLVTILLAFSGLVHESMIRGYAWRFIEIGRNLERSYQTISLIRALVTPVQSQLDRDIVLETLLLTVEALITYRRRYRARTDIVNALELVLMDDTNPRSLHYLLQQLDGHINALPSSNNGPVLSAERRAIVGLLHKVQLCDLPLICEGNDENEREKLDLLLQESQDLINELSGLLSDRYFDHLESYQEVAENKMESE